MKKLLSITFCFVLGLTLPAYSAIKGIYYEIYAPYSFKGPSGVPQGMLIDTAEAVFMELNLKVEHELISAWSRAQKKVEKGLLDFLITIPNAKRAKWSTATDIPVINAPFHIFALKKNTSSDILMKIKTKDELPLLKENGIKITMLRGHGWAVKNIMPIVGEDEIYWLSKSDQVFKFIKKRRRNSVTFMNVPVGLQILKDMGYLNDFVVYPPMNSGQKLFVSGFHILISKKSTYHRRMDEINAAVKKLTDNGTFSTIFKKWVK